MTDWFFYQERGATKGPVKAEDLRERVRDGSLRAFDLIYKEGESGWKMAMEHPDLRDAFREAGQNVMKGRPWVCLRRKGEDSLDFVTDGPFSDDEVRTALASGRLGYADYLWRNEFAEWQRIGGIPEFNPRAGQKKVAAPEPDARELLANVVELKREKSIPRKIEIPAEAEGDDLAGPRDGAGGSVGEETRIIVKRPAPAPPPPPPTTRGAPVKSAPTGRTLVPKPDLAQTEAAKAKARAAAAAVTVMAKSPRAPAGDGAPPPPPVKPSGPPTKSPGRRSSRRPSSDASPGAEMFASNVKRRRRPGFWADWGIVGGLCVALVVGISFLILRHAGERPPATVGPAAPPPAAVALTAPEPIAPVPSVRAMPTPTPPSPVDAPSEEPAVDGVTDDEPVAPPAPVPTARVASSTTRAPTDLRLSVGVSNGEARIDLRSNGGSDVPITVQIVGFAGQVADAPAFYRYVTLRGPGQTGTPVKMPDFDLPQGRFRVSAESGELRREANLNYGVGESKYRQAVGRQRKLAAAALWQERLKVFRVSEQLADALKTAGVGKRLPARAFANLDGVRKSSGARYLYFDDWTEAKAIVDGGRTKVTPDLIARARRLRDRVATASLWRGPK